MSRPITRRRFLAAAAAGLAAGCGPRNDRTLRVLVFAGAHEKQMRQVFVPAFQAATGARAVLVPGGHDAIPLLKAAPAGQPPFDLLVTDATQGYPAARGGLFRQLDLDNIPNHQTLAPAALDNWLFRDRYGVTYPDAVMTLAYRKDIVTPPPAGWGDFLRADLRGRLALYRSFYMSLHTFACVRAAAEKKPGTAHRLVRDDLQGVLRFAKEHRDLVRFWWPSSSDMITGLASRDCSAGNIHSPEYLQALRNEPRFGAVVPDADRTFVQVFWAVAAGSPRAELAEQAINVIFSEEVQTGFARHGSATAVLPAARAVAAADPYWKTLYPHTEEQLRALRYYPYDVYFDHWDEIDKFWSREVLGGG